MLDSVREESFTGLWRYAMANIASAGRDVYDALQ